MVLKVESSSLASIFHHQQSTPNLEGLCSSLTMFELEDILLMSAELSHPMLVPRAVASRQIFLLIYCNNLRYAVDVIVVSRLVSPLTRSMICSPASITSSLLDVSSMKH